MTLDKAALRQQMQVTRAALPEADRGRVARDLCGHADALMSLLDRARPVISSYWAIGSELDPKPLEQQLIARGASICLPVMVGKALPLLFRTYAPGDDLVARAWGIQEPGVTAAACTPHVLLVPLLAVDPTGVRLGYGGGFYDRTLQQLRALAPTLAVGVAYAEQMIDTVPTATYDQRLDWVLSPSGLHRCSAAQ
jgi:5-formyltetrahydrofolate cyclo-ligase